MDQSESGLNIIPEEESGVITEGFSSSLELGNVKQVLSVKMEKPESHYTSITPLGKGSFGEVHSAHDALLGREVAIKSLKKQFRDEEEVVDRFLKEARGTSQLEHPNIMPVHEMGVTDDLGIYFTMKKIEGDTLKEILDRLEANTSFYIKKYPLNKLLEVFLAVCNGIAFAHSKGVIHRDLKPANIMIGEFGEVLILDWGLVKHLEEKDGQRSSVKLRMDEFDVGTTTLDGAISGTPNYMSPEQAEGKVDDVDFQSDVYSLGAILYHILTYLPPFERTQLRKLLENVKGGVFQSPRKRCPELKIPKELEAICMKAMSRFQVNRYRSIEKFADDVRNYIGHRDVTAYKAPRYVRVWNACRRNPIKSSVFAAVIVAGGLVSGIQESMKFGIYDRSRTDAEELLGMAAELSQQAREKYDVLQALGAATKYHEKTSEETELEKELSRLLYEVDTKYNLATSYYSRIPQEYRSKEPVVKGLKAIFTDRINLALYRHDYDMAQRWVEEIREAMRLANRPLEEADRSYLERVDASIKGYGSLNISVPPNVHEMIIWPFDITKTRTVLGDPIKRGTEFPLEVKILRKGSYQVMVTRSDGRFLSYPIMIGHGEHKVLELEVPDHIPEGMAFIPGGEFIFGGPESRFYRQHIKRLPAFFMKQHEVTVSEYLEFWKTLTTEQEKKSCMSRIRFSHRDRLYHDAWDDDGKLLDVRLSYDYPVVGITKFAADAFCDWKSKQIGAVIRLPSIEEWEKAARGVDGRTYVWGNGFDADQNLTLTRKNAKGKKQYPYWAPPGKFTRDRSVYSVSDMAGNVRELTSTPLPNDTEFYQIKGGSASTPQNFLPCSYSSDTPVVPSDVGFRYLMEISK